MNDNDIELITSLIGGELPEPEQAEAFARIGSDPELQEAYEQQLAVASMLATTPAVAMTADETASLHTTLRTELRLGEATATVATTPSGWSRWWVPLTGLATAAVVVFAIAVLPGALDGTDSADVVSAPAAEQETTVPASELETFNDGEALLEGGADSAESSPSPTMAATEPAAAEGSSEESLSEYFIAPQAARQSQLELPILEGAAVAGSGVGSALDLATESARVDVDALTACFAPGAAGSALEPVGVTPDLTAVYAIATDLETGIETSVTIDLSTCEITETG